MIIRLDQTCTVYAFAMSLNIKVKFSNENFSAFISQQIVQLENKLRKTGALKYNCEVDEFWAAIRKNPTVFNYYLEKLNTDSKYWMVFPFIIILIEDSYYRISESWGSQKMGQIPYTYIEMPCLACAGYVDIALLQTNSICYIVLK